MENYSFDIEKLGQNKYLAGTDEAGRGPIAGPVVAAAVILDLSNPIPGLNDSKKLKENERKELYEEIKNKALSFSFHFIDHNKIDEINIYQASKLAMIKSIEKLNIKPNVILSDAMPFDIVYSKVMPLIKGDTISASIMAASIVAKVERDNYMIELDKKYPLYGFAKHKGYPTKMHREIVKKYGPTPFHRMTFSPLKQMFI